MNWLIELFTQQTFIQAVLIISFICGAIIFKERNLRAKALDLALILLGMVFIWIGTIK